LASAEGFGLLGDSRGATDAVSAAVTGHPDVVVVDPWLRLDDGIVACRLIRAASPQSRLLVTASRSSDELAVVAVLAGAAGFLPKQAGNGPLVDAVRNVATQPSPRLDVDLDVVLTWLSDRNLVVAIDDRQLLHLLASGLTDGQIAALTGWPPTWTTDRITAIADVFGLSEHRSTMTTMRRGRTEERSG
jgi:DNA-binding NarL/FixJ family response regulator